jgi:hypothetical protein
MLNSEASYEQRTTGYFNASVMNYLSFFKANAAMLKPSKLYTVHDLWRTLLSPNPKEIIHC